MDTKDQVAVFAYSTAPLNFQFTDREIEAQRGEVA